MQSASASAIKQYASRNETYGLSILRPEHLSAAEQQLAFEFTGKRNKPLRQSGFY